MARSKYDPDKTVLIAGWTRNGLTKEQVAKNLGISRSTLAEWEGRYPDVADALKRGAEIIDTQVENALLQAAMGFEVVEDAVTNKGDVVPVRRYFPPNVTALIFWLKNRKPREWRDRRELEHSGQDGGPIQVAASLDLKKLTDEELNRLAEIARRARRDDSAAGPG